MQIGSRLGGTVRSICSILVLGVFKLTSETPRGAGTGAETVRAFIFSEMPFMFVVVSYQQ